MRTSSRPTAGPQGQIRIVSAVGESRKHSRSGSPDSRTPQARSPSCLASARRTNWRPNARAADAPFACRRCIPGIKCRDGCACCDLVITVRSFTVIVATVFDTNTQTAQLHLRPVLKRFGMGLWSNAVTGSLCITDDFD